MIGIIIATHGQMAKGIHDAVEMLMGSLSNVEYLVLLHEDSSQTLRLKMKEAIKRVDSKKGVVICTDFMGATPYNQALVLRNFMTNHSIEIISGVNLPMVIDLINHQLLETSLEDATASALKTAISGIMRAKKMTNDNPLEDDF